MLCMSRRNQESAGGTIRKAECSICGKKTETETEMLTHIESTEDQEHESLRDDIGAAPSVSEIAEDLVRLGARYVSLNTTSVDGGPVMINYWGAGEEIENYVRENNYHHNNRIGLGRIGGEIRSTRVGKTSRESLHLVKRLPLYIDEGLCNLSPVTLEEGKNTVQKAVRETSDKESWSNKKVKLEALTEDLVSSGATRVELSTTELECEAGPKFYLRVATGKEGELPVIDAEEIEFGSEKYPLVGCQILTYGGGTPPEFTWLYYDDKPEKTDKQPRVSTKQGQIDLREHLNRIDDAEPTWDYEHPQREMMENVT
jgi:hypothetical protein